MNDATQLPTVTIIIANYNYGQYIANAIDSACSQDYPGSLQICVVNDGSTDDSWDIIKEKIEGKETTKGDLQVIEKDGDRPNHKLIAINRKNGGASVARNTGINYTWDNTHVFAILDADDEYYPRKVSYMVRKFLEDPVRIGVVYTDYDIHDHNTDKIIREFKQPFNRDVLTRECIVHSNALINKLALAAVKEETGFYDPALHGPAGGDFIGCSEDYDLWLRISEKFMIVHIPESLAVANITGINQTTNVTPEIFHHNWEHIMNKTRKRMDV